MRVRPKIFNTGIGYNSKKAITLIALVVTIVILLILVGVTIALVLR